MGAPFARGSDTSRAAAEAIEPDISTLQGIVYSAVKKSGERGATCYEIERQAGMLHQTASARITELADAGFLRDSGKRRPTKSGRPAIVWVTGR